MATLSAVTERSEAKILAPGLRSIAALQKSWNMPLENPEKKEATNRGGLAQFGMRFNPSVPFASPTT